VCHRQWHGPDHRTHWFQLESHLFTVGRWTIFGRKLEVVEEKCVVQGEILSMPTPSRNALKRITKCPAESITGRKDGQKMNSDRHGGDTTG